MTVKGTYYGATSDIEGNFRIERVNPGTYTVEVSLLGYKLVQFTGVKVEAGQVTTLRAKLEETVLTLGQDIVVVGEKPLFDIQETASRRNMAQADIQAAAVQNVQAIVSMQPGVVMADNWLLMYMCWEVMGLASYLLIGFWYERPEAAKAASKAFIVTRFGDVGFGLALVLMWTVAGTFTFEGVFHLVESGSWTGPTLVAASLLLFMGAMGKSAQFPLHVWLPDAMAGPTPGSALIHAATMVAAGVYLVARSYPLFEANPATLHVIATIGAITAVMAALIAVVMDDIKKVLAYSTISQLGYMMLALGMGSWVAAIFHLMTHAFFKALLFLAAGSVIHSCHTQDLHEMGGLWRKMPWTMTTWVLGALSLAGIPPLAGFWSKDEILLATFKGGHYGFLAVATGTAMLTAFYMGRATFLAFFAEPGPDSKTAHAHESPRVITGPLAVLATLAVVSGFVGSPFGGYAFGKFLGEHGEGEFNIVLATVAVVLALVAIGYAYVMYVRRTVRPDWYMDNKFVSAVLVQRFRIDEAYDTFLVGPVMVLSRFARRLDIAVVDGVVRAFGGLGLLVSRGLAVFDRKGVDGVVDGLGDSVRGAGAGIRRILTGNVQLYLLLLVAPLLDRLTAPLVRAYIRRNNSIALRRLAELLTAPVA